jgi:tetratricopeptide (TPR) repeat protein
MTRVAPLLLLLGACASDRYLANPGHGRFDHRDWAGAAEDFAKEAAKPGANQVLFLMDQGAALFEARRYRESNEVFLRAEKLAEIKDYTSISEEIGTLATSDNVRGYKGEDFEKVLINVYLALGYAALGEVEEAQVEARKINQLLYRMIHEGKRNYQESPFARYLSAMLWESAGEWSDAYIDYKKTYELDPAFPDIGRDLLAIAKRGGFREDIDDWKQKFPDVTPRGAELAEPKRGVPAYGELVLIFEKGAGPRKIPRDGQDSSLPRFVPRYSNVARARAIIDGTHLESFVTALDVTNTSIRYLEDRIGRMAAAKLAGTIAKGALAYGVNRLTKSEDLGWLAFFVLLASDRADLRHWMSLPAELQLARVPLPAGKHNVHLEVLGWSGETIETIDSPTWKSNPGTSGS